MDQWGDGWNGASLSISDCNDFILAGPLSVTGGFYEFLDICLDISDEFFTITVGGGQFDHEIAWTLFDTDGSVQLEGGAGTVTTCGTHPSRLLHK